MQLPDGSEVPSVPFANLWLVARTVMIGCVSVRYHLTPRLLRLGGHLGYEIRPRYRRLGFGHRALALGIQHAREHGMCDLLLTCDDTNAGSIRIIERAGGVLWDTIPQPQEPGRSARRYWIKAAGGTGPR